MRDFCGELRFLCAAYLKDAGIETRGENICVRNADCEAAYAVRDGLYPILPDTTELWLGQVVQAGNRICFLLSDKFYYDAASHIIDENPPVGDSDIGGFDDKTAYARARMRMLARKHYSGNVRFPPDARRAVWRAICARSPDISPSLREKYLDEAATLALAIGRGVPLRDRQKYRDSCALAAACLERLLNDKIYIFEQGDENPCN